MNPHMFYGYMRSNPAGYPARSPFFWGFGAPLVGGLLGGFLGSALLTTRGRTHTRSLMRAMAERHITEEHPDFTDPPRSERRLTKVFLAELHTEEQHPATDQK